MANNEREEIWKKRQQDASDQAKQREIRYKRRQRYYNVDSSMVNQAYIDSFMKDAGSYFNTATKDYESMGWGNASNLYNTRNTSYTDLSSRADAIGAYLYHNKNNLNKEAYDYYNDYLDSFYEGGQGIADAFKSNMDYYSQWATQEDYDAYYKDFQEKQKMANSVEGKAGWQKYLADQSTPKESIPWWQEAILRAHATSYDNPVAMAFNTAVYDYQRDESYRMPSDNWTDDERNIFGYYYATNPAQAYTYAVNLNNQKNLEQEQKKMAEIVQNATSNFGSGAVNSLGALFAATTGLADTLNYLAMQAANRPITEDGFVSPFEYSQAVQSGISNKLNEMGGTLNVGGMDIGLGNLYGIGMSIASSQLSGRAFGAVGTLVNFFGQGAAQGVKEAKQMGATDEQALLYGSLSGAFEGIAEMIGFDHLTSGLTSASTMKAALKNIISQAGAEGLEEGWTSLANSAIDMWVLQDKGKILGKVNELMANGASETDAKKQALNETFGEALYDTITGAISGAVGGGIETGIKNYNINTQFKNEYIKDPDSLKSLLEGIALENPSVDTSKLMEKYRKGEKISANELRKFVYANEQSVWNQDKSKLVDATEKRLSELGEKGDLRKLAESIVNAQYGYSFDDAILDSEQAILNNEGMSVKDLSYLMAEYSQNAQNKQSLSKADQKAIRNSEYGSRVSNELNPNMRDETSSAWAQGVKTNRLGNTAGNVAKTRAALTQLNEASKSRKKLPSNAISYKSGAVDASLTPKGRDAKIEGENKTVSETYARAEGYKGLANETFSKYYKGENIEEYALGFREAYDYGLNGTVKDVKDLANHGSFKSYINEEAREMAFNAGVVDAKYMGIKSKTIKVDGDYKVTVPMSNKALSESKQATIELMKVLAPIAKVNMSTMVSLKDHGLYDPKTNTIYIDLAMDGRDVMIFTLAHELTHHLKRVNPEQFDEFARALFEEVGKTENIEERLAKWMRENKKYYPNMAQAEFKALAREEVVAEMCESFLTDEKVVQRISQKVYETDKGLWNTIKKWFENLVAKLKKLFADLDPQSENGRIVREMGDRLDTVRQMWADMVVEAGNVETEATQEQIKNSRKDLEKLDADYLSAVERGDMEAAQKMVDEVANATMPDSKIRTEDGKLRVVYHGTNTGDFTVFNPDYIGMSSGDDGFFGMGFYFAYSKGEASYYGSSRVIPAYLNLKNPFNFEKELQSYQGKRASGGYAPDAVALMNFADKFPEIAKNVKIGVVENESDTVEDISLVEFSKAFKDVIENKTFEYREVENEFGEKETVVTADAKTVEYQYDGKKYSYTDYGFQKRFWGTPNELDVAYEYLANSVYEYVDMIPRTRLILDNNREFTDALKDMRYDGTIQSEYGDEAVAFYPNQIKSADPVTYDDEGNVIPLSQRFNSENEDIRYSHKTVDPITSREELAKALSKVARGEDRAIVESYKANVNLIKGETARLESLRKEIDEIKYKKSITYEGRELSVKEFEQIAYTRAEEMGIDAERVKFKALKESGKYIATVDGKKILEAEKRFRTKDDIDKLATLEHNYQATIKRISGYDKKLLQIEAMSSIKQLINREKKASYDKAKAEGKEALKEYKAQAIAEQKKITERYQEMRKKNVEGRKTTEMRHKLMNTVHTLDQLLVNPTKKKHIPIALQKPIAEALNVLNRDTVGANERLAEIKNKLMTVNDAFEQERLLEQYNRIMKQGDRLAESLAKLQTSYDAILESDDRIVRNSHDEVISNMIQKLIKKVGDTSVRDMNLEQLELAYNTYRAILKSVRDANKAFATTKEAEITTLAHNVMSDVLKYERANKKIPVKLDKALSAEWMNLKPIYAFERIGSKTFIELYENIRHGEDVWAVDTREAMEFMDRTKKQYGFDKWDRKKEYPFKSKFGQEFKLNLEQIMSIYAYTKRGEQATDHLINGGFTFDKHTVTKEKKNGIIEYDVVMDDPTAYSLNEEIIGKINATLNKEQRGFVDAMQNYLSKVMGEKGNEVSRVLYDINLFGEENYFPLKTSEVYKERVREQARGEVKIKNKGFTKETSPNSTSPVILTPFTDVWATHCVEMSMYHALTLPLEDFYRVFNYKEKSNETNSEDGVTRRLEAAYGKAVTNYIDQFLVDVNGGTRSDPRADAFSKGLATFKKAKVMASLSVIAQQFSAPLRAMTYIDVKYFIDKPSKPNHKANWEELKKYAPIAIIKEMGYFDVGLGKSTVDWIKNEKPDWKGVIDEYSSKGAAWADEVGWIIIWKAVKREMAATTNLKVNSDEFLQQCGKRFTEVATRTQVYDSVFARSGYMRSKDTGAKMFTAFMAESTTTLNIIEDAITKGIRGDKKFASRAIGSCIAASIANSALSSVAYAMRDDDEDEEYWEKYFQSLGNTLWDNFKPWGMIPYIRDIASLMEGYTVSRSDLTLWQEVFWDIKTLAKNEYSEFEDWLDVITSISQITGIPLKNLVRDLKGIWKTAESFIK